MTNDNPDGFDDFDSEPAGSETGEGPNDAGSGVGPARNDAHDDLDALFDDEPLGSEDAPEPDATPADVVNSGVADDGPSAAPAPGVAPPADAAPFGDAGRGAGGPAAAAADPNAGPPAMADEELDALFDEPGEAAAGAAADPGVEEPAPLEATAIEMGSDSEDSEPWAEEAGAPSGEAFLQDDAVGPEEVLEGEALGPEEAFQVVDDGLSVDELGEEAAEVLETPEELDVAEVGAVVKEAVFGMDDDELPAEEMAGPSSEAADPFGAMPPDEDEGDFELAPAAVAAPPRAGAGARLSLAVLTVTLLGTVAWSGVILLGVRGGAGEPVQVAAAPPAPAPEAGTGVPPAEPVLAPDAPPAPVGDAVTGAEPERTPPEPAEFAAAPVPGTEAPPVPTEPEPSRVAELESAEAAGPMPGLAQAPEPEPAPGSAVPVEAEPAPPIEPVPAAAVEAPREPEPPPAPQLPAAPVDVDVLRRSLKINAIRHALDDPRAIVNLQRVYEGDRVDGVQVVQIEPDRVLFEAADGTRFTVRF